MLLFRGRISQEFTSCEREDVGYVQLQVVNSEQEMVLDRTGEGCG